MSRLIATIGIYGFTEEQFFETLLRHHARTLCDIRMRRGVRGREYAFANRTRLQTLCNYWGINYVHLKELAPTLEIRQLQRAADESAGVRKRQRSGLDEAFIERYVADRLAHFDIAHFMQTVAQSDGIVVLMCVERLPQACHRAIAAEHIATRCGYEVKHLLP